MEENKPTKFTFYEMYYEAMKNESDEYAGRLIQSICKFMFDDVKPDLPENDPMSFDLAHIFKTLGISKEIEQAGRVPKTLNKRMKHFTFIYSYYTAINLLDEKQSGQYIKAICSYMFEGKEPKGLLPLADKYFRYAMWDLELSKLRTSVGRKGGTKKKTAPEIILEKIMEDFNLTGEIYNPERYLKDIDLNKAYEYFKDNRPPEGQQIYYALENYKKAQKNDF